ncbi:MAG: hypothetical protein ACTSU4_00795 [Promethearchaeota archaeon]
MVGTSGGGFALMTEGIYSEQGAFYLTSEMLDLVWKYQTPGILFTEKHLSESNMTVELSFDDSIFAKPIIYEGSNYKRYLDTENGISPLLFPPSNEKIFLFFKFSLILKQKVNHQKSFAF